jgi:hypothetical protein
MASQKFFLRTQAGSASMVCNGTAKKKIERLSETHGIML